MDLGEKIDPQSLIFERDLTPDEIKAFEKIAQMEAVHNELGAALSLYKEQIITTRNKFVQAICRKYSIEKPRDASYDPVSKKVVSVFHPNLKGHKIISMSGNALGQVASELIHSAITKLGEVYLATKGK